MPNAVTALIHDRLGQTLKDVFARAASGDPTALLEILPQPGDTLVAQLEEGGDAPPRVTLGFALDIVTSAIPRLPDGPGLDLPDPVDLLRNARNALRGRLAFFDKGNLGDGIAALIAAGDSASLRGAGDALFERIDAAFAGSGRTDVFQSVGQWVRLRPFIGGDIGTVLPLVTIVNAVQGSGLTNVLDVPQSVERGLLDYFFRSSGYRTVDGASVVSSVHLSDIGSALSGIDPTDPTASGRAALRQLQGHFSKPTAEHYIRDISRVIVESAYDAARGMGVRYRSVTDRLRARKAQEADKAAVERKFVAWFRGFSAITESAAMRGVEVATQGVSQIQTNPLIGAAAGSFAGTVARKLAQDSFLTVLARDLG